jgi:hypothetical protein
MRLFVLLLAFAGLLSSCNGHKITDETLKVDGTYLATLQCEAKKLQEERFKLAQDIRELEDSVMYSLDSLAKPSFQAKLDQLVASKEDMHSRTKAMADSITHVLNGFYEGTYKNTADRRLLDVALSAAYQSKCQ